MAIETFGVTVETIRKRANRLGITASTTPDDSAVEDLIEEAATEVAIVLGDELGIALDSLDQTGTTYVLARMIVADLATVAVIRARTRGNPDQAQALYTQARDRLRLLRERPTSAGAGLASRPNGPGVVAARPGSIAASRATGDALLRRLLERGGM